MTSLIQKFYNISPRSIVEGVKSAVQKHRTPSYLADHDRFVEFLRSDQYREIMSAKLPLDGSYDKHEAQNFTRNYQYRHFTASHQLGVFRWRGLQRHMDRVLEIVAVPEARVLDFGGAGCPLGLRSEIIDQLPKDRFSNEITLHSIADVEGKVDAIFSSHCLEHVRELEDVISQMIAALSPGGYLILHLPSYTCDRWWAGYHSHASFNDHFWNFALSADEDVPEHLQNVVCIDSLLARLIDVELAEHCGDDSLFVLARKQHASA
jgi:SAM-dependent methyltransferase